MGLGKVKLLLLAVSAAAATAAEAPSLTVTAAVNGGITVTMRVTSGVRYQIESSADLASWGNEGEAFIASGTESSRDFPADGAGRFFRVREAAAPPPGAPAALREITITNTQNATGPVTYTVQFTGTTSGRFEITSGALGMGTFTYTPSGTTARLVMSYEDFPGDKDDLALDFSSGSSAANPFTGTQLTGGVEYRMEGTFSFAAQ